MTKKSILYRGFVSKLSRIQKEESESSKMYLQLSHAHDLTKGDKARFKAMSNDEAKHAGWLGEMAVRYKKRIAL